MRGFLRARHAFPQALRWLALALFFGSTVAVAQQASKVPRVAVLSALSAPSMSTRVDAFRKGLRDLGYVEGKNIVLEYRYADGKADALPALVSDLLRTNVDVIVTTGPTTTRPARNATATVPIVMGFDSDPVGSGFASSLSRPGGNVTGLSSLAPEVSGKQLQLLKELNPKFSRVAVFGNATTAGNNQTVKEIEAAAAQLRAQVQYIELRQASDLENAFRKAVDERADAVIVLPNTATTGSRARLAELAVKSRLPAMYYTTEFVEDGGLMTYGVSITDLFRRSATYVDKILKGAKPGDLPIEQPVKFDLVINLKAAKQIGLTIPTELLAQADRVIR